MLNQYCEAYKKFLNLAKTETETVNEVFRIAVEKGFQRFDRRQKPSCAPGEKWVQMIRGKGVVLCVMGRQALNHGCKMIAAHMDSPHLGLKPVPLDENHGNYYLKTHYYGKIKKYQWTCIPLALHGIYMDEEGKGREMVIGENEDDPVFCITDLLPHLAQEQMKKSIEHSPTGEQLQLLTGLSSENDVMNLFWERYGFRISDFGTAEIRAVPAGKAMDLGSDRSMIAAYGQDDRACVYGTVRALLDLEKIPEYTSFVLLADKEEVGSESSAGLYSRTFLEMPLTMAEIQSVSPWEMLAKTECLSADVVCAHDPMYPETTDEKNTARLGKGLAVVRYTGHEGKKGNSEASASFLKKTVGIFDKQKVAWQYGEMGAVDVGGGTTVAKCMAHWGAEVLDVGVSMLSMHSPMEVTAKQDVWNFYLGMKAFLQDTEKQDCDEIQYCR